MPEPFCVSALGLKKSASRMALSFGSDPLDPYAGLRIGRMGMVGRQHEQRRVKSVDFGAADCFPDTAPSRAPPRPAPAQQAAQPRPAAAPLAPPRAQPSPPAAQPAVARFEAAAAAPAAAPRARGLNIQFGVSPGLGQEPAVSPRLEGSEWESIDERTKLMAQLHALQAEIVHLARRDNKRIGVATSSPAASPPAPRRRVSRSRSRSVSSREGESLASTSFSSSDTLFEDEPDWADLAAADPFKDDEHHLAMNFADLQRLRDFRGAALQRQERPSVRAALQQLLTDLLVLGRALMSCAEHNTGAAAAAVVALLAVGAYTLF